MRERETREKQTKRKRTAARGRPLISVGFFRFFIFPENHSNSSFYLHGTFLHLHRGALLFFYHTLRTKNTVTVVPFCEKVFSFDLFARVSRIPSFASRLLRRDFERQIGWTAHKHSSEREKKKAILAAVSNFESDDRAIVPAKSARVQIRDDFLIHAFASRMICADPSSPSREVCGKYTLFVCNTYARIAKLPADLTYSEPPRGVRPVLSTIPPPYPAQALGCAAGAHAALTESLDKIKGLPTPLAGDLISDHRSRI